MQQTASLAHLAFSKIRSMSFENSRHVLQPQKAAQNDEVLKNDQVLDEATAGHAADLMRALALQAYALLQLLLLLVLSV
jgi:hypothetical protein